MSLKDEITAELKRRTRKKETMPTHVVLSPVGTERAKDAGWDEADPFFCGLQVVVQDQDEPYLLVGVA